MRISVAKRTFFVDGPRLGDTMNGIVLDAQRMRSFITTLRGAPVYVATKGLTLSGSDQVIGAVVDAECTDALRVAYRLSVEPPEGTEPAVVVDAYMSCGKLRQVSFGVAYVRSADKV